MDRVDHDIQVGRITVLLLTQSWALKKDWGGAGTRLSPRLKTGLKRPATGNKSIALLLLRLHPRRYFDS